MIPELTYRGTERKKTPHLSTKEAKKAAIMDMMEEYKPKYTVHCMVKTPKYLEASPYNMTYVDSWVVSPSVIGCRTPRNWVKFFEVDVFPCIVTVKIADKIMEVIQ